MNEAVVDGKLKLEINLKLSVDKLSSNFKPAKINRLTVRNEE
jgi:hypothetical protein